MQLFSYAEYRRLIPAGGISEKELKLMDGQLVIDGTVRYVDEKGQIHERMVKNEWCEKIGPLAENAIRVMCRWLAATRKENAELMRHNLQLRESKMKALEKEIQVTEKTA